MNVCHVYVFVFVCSKSFVLTMAWAIEYLGVLIVSVYVDMRMYSVILL